MRFDSLTFVVFLVFVVLLHHLLPWRIGRVVLLVASYAFYGATEPWFLSLLFISTYVDYLVAIWLDRTRGLAKRRGLISISIATNIGMLAFFKYAGFVSENLNVALGWFGGGHLPVPSWALPVGISFYSFQTLSYSIDVYRKRLPAERDFLTFALYVSFFPQLVAGPIERATRLLPQLRQKQPIAADDLTYGVQRILVGMVKKVVFADRIAFPVDSIFAHYASSNAPNLILATVGFAFRLYLDFSAYTDIAIGLGRIVGVQLSENFNRPFLARNSSDFWSRWHMTLTTWFRDYVHAPMGGLKRGRPWRNALTTIITMTLVGIWHGAAWNFVCFGVLSGVELAIYHALRLRKGRPSQGPLFGRTTFGTVSAIFLQFWQMIMTMAAFRAPTVAAFFDIITSPFTHPWAMPATGMLLYVPVFIAVLAWEALAEADKQPRLTWLRAAPVRGAAWALLVMAIILAAVDHSEEFIYFRF